MSHRKGGHVYPLTNLLRYRSLFASDTFHLHLDAQHQNWILWWVYLEVVLNKFATTITITICSYQQTWSSLEESWRVTTPLYIWAQKSLLHFWLHNFTLKIFQLNARTDAMISKDLASTRKHWEQYSWHHRVREHTDFNLKALREPIIIFKAQALNLVQRPSQKDS